MASKYLTVASASIGRKSSSKFSHPGYSLLEWKRLCDALPTKEIVPQEVNYAELSRHNSEVDCWTAIRGKVYDVTRFLKYHPGRKAQLMRGAGVDSSELFDKAHSWVNEETILQKHFIGYLIPGEGPKFITFSVIATESVSHDTRLFSLKCPESSSKLHFPAGQYVRLKASINGETVVREYTPIVYIVGNDGAKSCDLMLMIKLYSHGKMTRYLSTITPGDALMVSGPVGSFCADSVCSAKVLVLIAAGTGLTPMISLLHIRYHQQKPLWSTLLLFANKTEEDILWRKELDMLCHASSQPIPRMVFEILGFKLKNKKNDNDKKNWRNGLCAISPKFQVVHCLSSPSSNWRGESGKICLSTLEKYVPHFSEDVKVCISGPPPFSKSMLEYLMQINYPNEAIHCFD